jgi:hypothetical protein
MAGASFTDAALGAGSRIGRYFGIVSAVPSALFVLFVYALVRSGAWAGEPHWSAAADAVKNLSLGEVSALSVLSLAFALALHPLQFALLQLFEGYWGSGAISRRLAARMTLSHRRRGRRLELERKPLRDRKRRLRVSKMLEDTAHMDEAVRVVLGDDALRYALEAYPVRKERYMPTRLGNTLRRYEDEAGRIYGLDALTVHPHLVLAGDKAHLAILNDAREQLDLAVRLCAISLLASGVACVFLVTDGLWLLIALVPYLAAYVCYRGSVVAAANWGVVLAAVIDLNRFDLYEKLHLVLPNDTVEERHLNRDLRRILRPGRSEPHLQYAHPPQTSVEITAGTPRRTGDSSGASGGSPSQ